MIVEDFFIIIFPVNPGAFSDDSEICFGAADVCSGESESNFLCPPRT